VVKRANAKGGVIRGWCWLSNLGEELTSLLGADRLQQFHQLLVEVTDVLPRQHMSTSASGEPKRTPPTTLNWTGPHAAERHTHISPR
jgi:hypothetical protein